MSLSGIKTLPSLRGVLQTVTPWGGTLSRQGWRIYPYQLGAKVRTDTTTTSVKTFGKGEFAANDYVLTCQQIYYGNSYFYIPRVNQISRISALGVSDDEITLTVPLTLSAGDYLLNLGADTATDPLSQPNYDGSRITPILSAGTPDASQLGTYVVTGNQGQFECWLPSGVVLVDLLICDSSGQPRNLWPLQALGPEVS